MSSWELCTVTQVEETPSTLVEQAMFHGQPCWLVRHPTLHPCPTIGFISVLFWATTKASHSRSAWNWPSATLLETRRLAVAEANGLTDQSLPVPMSILWQELTKSKLPARRTLPTADVGDDDHLRLNGPQKANTTKMAAARTPRSLGQMAKSHRQRWLEPGALIAPAVSVLGLAGDEAMVRRWQQVSPRCLPSSLPQPRWTLRWLTTLRAGRPPLKNASIVGALLSKSASMWPAVQLQRPSSPAAPPRYPHVREGCVTVRPARRRRERRGPKEW
ncbi:hypothetical protein HU200_014014 [Digitaria exilis]|uniref:Uncharacterized protein n=1 Tax=Digitaria exilis TaxID=1010633 RepID=A0A835FC50_9POAL|nr:hypothetical protein HU200_014014 [Digitaria exilis]